MIQTAKMAKWFPGFLLIILSGLIGVPFSKAQDVFWVEAEGTAPVMGDDLEKAKNQAVEVAARNAVADALASDVTVETLLVNLRLSGSILGAIPYGKVVTKEILEQETIKSTDSESNHKDSLYRVRIKAGVVQDEDGEEHSFFLDAAINQSVFKDGDELEIYIRSTKDCHFAIYNILEDEKIIRLLPNYLSTKDVLTTNKNFTFPSEEDRKKGLKLRVHLPEDKESVTESIYILALPHPINFKSINVQEGIFGVFDGQTAFMKDLIRQVVSIPLNSRAEALMQYEIRKDAKGI